MYGRLQSRRRCISPDLVESGLDGERTRLGLPGRVQGRKACGAIAGHAVFRKPRKGRGIGDLPADHGLTVILQGKLRKPQRVRPRPLGQDGAHGAEAILAVVLIKMAQQRVPVHAGARILVNPVDDVPFVAFKRHQPTEADARDPEKDEKMYALKFVDGAWQNIGEAFSDKVGSDYDFTLSPSGTPFIAFKNGAVSPQVTTVMTYAGGAWSTVGENIGTAATSKIHLHAIADNKVVVCQIMSNKTFVGIWDGSSWTTGGIDALEGNPRPYEIRMAGDGANAYMFSINRAKALNEVNYGHNVMKFDGTSWSGLRQNYLREGATQTSIVGYDITVAPDGTVYLVTGDNAEDNENYHHRVEKYNADGTWSQVGGTIDYVLSSRCYSKIAVAPDGTVFVAYPNETVTPKTIEVVYFDAATKQWSAPASLGNGDGVEYTGDPNLSFVFDSKGKGYVTWLEDSKLLMYTFE